MSSSLACQRRLQGGTLGHAKSSLCRPVELSPTGCVIYGNSLDRTAALQQFLCELNNGLPIGRALESLALNALQWDSPRGRVSRKAMETGTTPMLLVPAAKGSERTR